MFKRFTQPAHDVVLEARDHAVRLGDCRIGTEHLLLGFLTAPSAVTELLTDFGIDVVKVESERAEFARSKDPIESDRDALAALGIDLEQVEAEADSVFGLGALEDARRNRDRRSPWRRRGSRQSVAFGGGDRLPLSSRSKNVVQLSLKEASRLRHDFIGPEHLALGMLNEGEGLACQILVSNGITLEQLRVSLKDVLRRAA